jgi:hypothetical protein
MGSCRGEFTDGGRQFAESSYQKIKLFDTLDSDYKNTVGVL